MLLLDGPAGAADAAAAATADHLLLDHLLLRVCRWLPRGSHAVIRTAAAAQPLDNSDGSAAIGAVEAEDGEADAEAEAEAVARGRRRSSKNVSP